MAFLNEILLVKLSKNGLQDIDVRIFACKMKNISFNPCFVFVSGGESFRGKIEESEKINVDSFSFFFSIEEKLEFLFIFFVFLAIFGATRVEIL